MPNYFKRSRFVAVIRKNQEQLHIILWAILAETLGAEWMSWVVELGQSALLSQYFAPIHHLYPSFQDVDAVLLFVNASGAVFAGSTTALCEACKSERNKMKDKDKPGVLIEGFLEKTAFAFKCGFLAVYTSFLGAGEQFSDHYSGTIPNAALFVWVVSFMLGPPLYVVSIVTGRRVWPLLLGLFRRAVPRDEETTEKRLNYMCILLCASIAGASWIAYPKSEGIWLLPFGWFCATAACFAGNAVGSLMEGWAVEGVNWVTIATNWFAILLGRILIGATAMPAFAAYPLLVVALDRFRGTFGGALSAYAAFAEDVASPVVGNHFDWKNALTNWFLNIIVGMTFIIPKLFADMGGKLM